jgi:hypothetical protein
MWRIIRAELKYDGWRIGLFLSLSFVAFLTIWLGVKWERNRIPMIMLMVLVLTMAAVYAGEAKRTVQKRDRLHLMFPISLWKIGLTHLLYPLIVLAIIYFILIVSVVAARPYVDYELNMPSLFHMLTLTGLVLFTNAVVLLYRDLRMTYTGKPQRFLIFLFWFVVYFGALVPFYVVTNFFGLFGENTQTQYFLVRLLETPSVFLLAGLLLSMLSFTVFVKRKSYVDS